MRETFLGLGSNVGDREKNLLQALLLLRRSLKIVDYSSLYNTTPIGYPYQENFLNMVVKTDTEEFTPFALLALVKSIEQEMGRRKTFHWGPRLIDIDILYMAGVHIESSDLIIPHRELWNRNFVLIPLSELTDHLLIENKKLMIDCMINKNSHNQVELYKSREEMPFNVQQ
jgi:2-amino-4-hydroxy-6-hydroxymethyldihydropteridine diphosphokinase